MFVVPELMCTSVECVLYSRVMSVPNIVQVKNSVNTQQEQPTPDGSPIPSGVHIQTILSDDGEARILFEFNEVSIQFTQDACADIALHLLAAVYASRSEQALYKYAMDNSLDPQQLVKFMRT